MTTRASRPGIVRAVVVALCLVARTAGAQPNELESQRYEPIEPSHCWDANPLVLAATTAKQKSAGGLTLLGEALQRKFPAIGPIRRHSPLAFFSFLGAKASADWVFLGKYAAGSFVGVWATLIPLSRATGLSVECTAAIQRAVAYPLQALVTLAREHYLRQVRATGQTGWGPWWQAMRPSAVIATTQDLFGRQFREHVQRRQRANLGFARPNPGP